MTCLHSPISDSLTPQLHKSSSLCATGMCYRSVLKVTEPRESVFCSFTQRRQYQQPQLQKRHHHQQLTMESVRAASAPIHHVIMYCLNAVFCCLAQQWSLVDEILFQAHCNCRRTIRRHSDCFMCECLASIFSIDHYSLGCSLFWCCVTYAGVFNGMVLRWSVDADAGRVKFDMRSNLPNQWLGFGISNDDKMV